MARPDIGEVGRWFEAYARPLTLYGRQWLDRVEAEDAVQDVFLRLQAQPKRPADVKAWLFRALRNAALSRLRSGGRRRQRETNSAAQTEPWFESRPDNLIDAQLARAELSMLPESEREIVMLRLWGEMTFEQMSAINGASAPTNFRLYQRALKSLRQRLESPCKTNPN